MDSADITGLTVYSWEQGKFGPRKEQLAKLVAVRQMGKREVTKRLEMMNGSANKMRNKQPKRRKRR